MYTVDFFINKFEAILEEFWIIGDWGKGGKHCASGHCGRSNNGGTEESKALEKVFSIITPSLRRIKANWDFAGWGVITAINDGKCIEYPQRTPKQRILAALYDIKKLQNPYSTDATSELIKNINVGDGVDQPVKEKSLFETLGEILKP